jgi:hypothetical protein
VSLLYVLHGSPFLRQGEIINNLLELKPQITEQKSIEDFSKDAKFEPIEHPAVIVVSQDCDLEWDYKARLGEASESKILAHIFFCPLYSPDEVKIQSGLTSQPWKRVGQNQDERYHHLDEAPINGTEERLPELIADFKATLSLPNEFVYWLVSTNQVVRKCALPSPYLEDFMNRLYHFLGRVATPPMTG